MNELSRPQSSELASTIGETTETAWIAPAEMTYDQWASIGRTMQQVNRSLNWWIGDWLNAGEHKYGDKYLQAVEATDASVESLRKYQAIAKRVARDVRKANLSWSHHLLVAYLPSIEHESLLNIALRYDLSTRSFKQVCELTDGQRAELVSRSVAEDLKRDQFYALLEGFSTEFVNPIKTIVKPVEEEEDEQPEEEQAFSGEIVDPQPSLFDDAGVLFADEGEEETYGDNLLSSFWSRAGVPVEQITYNEVRWEGATVRAEIDEDGEAVLAWEISLS